MRQIFRAIMTFGTLAPLALSAQAASAEPLSEAVRLALDSNPTLAAERARLAGTRENLPQARAGYLPSVALTYESAMTHTDRKFVSGFKTSSDADQTVTSLAATQPIYRGGRTIAAIKRARAEFTAGQEALRGAEQRLVFDVVSAYANVRRDLAGLAIRTESVRLLQVASAAAKERFAVGDVTRTDVAQVEARLAAALAALASARASLAASRADYTRLVGQAPDISDADLIPLPPMPQNLDESLEYGLAASPIIGEAEAAVRVAKQSIALIEGEGRPEITTSARVTSDYSPGGAVKMDDSRSFSARVRIPLYSGGVVRSRVRAAESALLRARALADAARRDVETGVATAYNNVIAADVIVEAADAREKAALAAFEGLSEELNAGLRSTIDLLDAEQELLDARLARARALRDRDVSRAALLAAMGMLDGASVVAMGPP